MWCFKNLLPALGQFVCSQWGPVSIDSVKGKELVSWASASLSRIPMVCKSQQQFIELQNGLTMLLNQLAFLSSVSICLLFSCQDTFHLVKVLVTQFSPCHNILNEAMFLCVKLSLLSVTKKAGYVCVQHLQISTYGVRGQHNPGKAFVQVHQQYSL